MASNFDDKIADLRKTFEKQQKLIGVFKALSSEKDLGDLLGLIVEETSRIMEAERSTVFLHDRERHELYSKVAQGSQEIRFPVGQGIAGHVAASGEVVHIPDAYADQRFNPEFDRLSGFRTRNIVCVPMRNAGHEITGVIQVLNRRDPALGDEDRELLLAVGAAAAVFVENALLYAEIERLFESIIALAAQTIDDRDPVTAGHSRRVTEYTLALARAMNRRSAAETGKLPFTPARLKQLEYACLLHDFGKIGVREYVLSKPSKISADRLEIIRLRMKLRAREAGYGPEQEAGLDEDMDFLTALNTKGFFPAEDRERLDRIHQAGFLDEADYLNLSVEKGNLNPLELEDMKSHVVKTRRMLEAIPWPCRLARVAELAGMHHEKMDGKGYPDALTADAIPLEARMMAVTDIYDALTAQDRPYKPAIPHDKARQIISFMVKDGELDSAVVDCFFGEKCFEVEAPVL